MRDDRKRREGDEEEWREGERERGLPGLVSNIITFPRQRPYWKWVAVMCNTCLANAQAITTEKLA